jgi:hypothetical protein
MKDINGRRVKQGEGHMSRKKTLIKYKQRRQ